MAQPTQAAIDMLRAHPETADQFEEAFGKGASAAYVKPQAGGVLNALKGVASDIGSGIVEAPGAIVRGAANAVNETSNAAFDAAKAINDHVDLGSVNFDVTHGAPRVWLSSGMPAKNQLQVPDAITPDEPTSTTGHLIEGVSQFTTGMLGAGKFLKAVGVTGEGLGTLGKFGLAAAKAGIADATVFDPHADRLSNLVQEHPALQNPITAFLAAKPGDGAAEGRFKNALEGFLTGTMLEGTVRGVKAIKLAKDGNLKAAAEEAAAIPEHQGPEAPAEAPAPGEAAPTANEPAAQAEAKPADSAAHAASEDGTTVAPDAAPAAGGEKPKRDVIDTRAPPPGFVFTPEEIDQYRKNQDARFSVGGQDMANYGEHFNFSKLNTSDDIKAAVNAMANVVDGRLNEIRGGNADGVRTWDEVKKNADTIAQITGGDPRILTQHLITTHDNVKHLDAIMKANGDMLVTLSAHSDKLAQMVSAGTPGSYGSMDALKAAYAHSTNLLGNNYAYLKGVQTNIARAQNAAKIFRDINPVIKQGIENINPEDDQLLVALAKRQAASSLGADPLASAGATRKLLEGSLLNRALAVHNEFWFNAVLSGVKTHVVNNTVNLVKSVFMPGEQMVAGLLSRNSAQFREGAYQYVGMTKALKDSFAMAQRAFNVQDNVLDYRGAYEGVHKQAISAAMFGQENTSLAPIINGIGTLARIPSRMLMAEDEFFKQITYRSRIYANATREGVEMGLPADQAGQLVERRMAEAFDPAGHANLVDENGRSVASRVNALKQAREATFTQPLDYGIGRWIESGAQAHPAIRLLMPFVRVPTNIIRDVWQHTPGLGLVQKQMKEEIAAGGERASMAYAKQATGSALWMAAIGAAFEGKITGNGPTDPQARKTWLLDNQPYSYVSTDPATGKKTFTSFSRLDPYSIPFGLAADFAHIAGQLGDEDKTRFATAATIAMVNNLASKTYLKGLIDAVNILQDDRGNGVQQYAEQRAASYVPNILGAANPDPYLREVRSVLDAMAAKVPGFSQTLPPRRDVLGQPMTVPMGYPFDAINPFTVKSVDPDPVRSEMARLASSDSSIRFPMPAPKIDGLDLTQVKGDDGLSAYDAWMKNIGEMTLGGRTLQDKLEDTVGSTAYQDSADGNATFKKSRKVDLIQRDLDRYRTRALQETLKDFPEVQQALHDYKTGSKRVRAGQAPSDDPFAVFNQ